MKAAEFAKNHLCDPDWVAIMGDRDVVVLTPGQRGTYSGFEATVQRHYCNGMYEVALPGGVACISESEFVPEPSMTMEKGAQGPRYVLVLGGFPGDQFVTLESDEDDGEPATHPASTRNVEEAMTFASAEEAEAEAWSLLKRFPGAQLKAIAKPLSDAHGQAELPFIVRVPSGESETESDECGLMFLCPTGLVESGVLSCVEDAVAGANDDNEDRSGEVIAFLEAAGFKFLGNPPLVRHFPPHQSVLVSQPWIGGKPSVFSRF